MPDPEWDLFQHVTQQPEHIMVLHHHTVIESGPLGLLQLILTRSWQALRLFNLRHLDSKTARQANVTF
jgi:hypothetical protein